MDRFDGHPMLRSVATLMVAGRTLFPITVAGLVLLAGMACQSTPPEPKSLDEARIGIRTRPECPPSSSPEYFYPDEAIPDFNERDRVIRSLYSELLTAAGLRPLSCGHGEIEAYRAFWSPATRPSILVTADWDGSQWLVAGREFTVSLWHTLAAERLPADVVKSMVSRTRPPADGIAFVEARKAATLWSTAVRLPAEAPPIRGIWIFEAAAEGLYRVVLRESRDTPVQAAGIELVRLAGIPVPEAMEDRGF